MQTVLALVLLVLLGPLVLIAVGTGLNLLFGLLGVPMPEAGTMLLSLLVVGWAGARAWRSRTGRSGGSPVAWVPWAWLLGMGFMTVFLAGMSTDSGDQGHVGPILGVGGVVAALPLLLHVALRRRQVRRPGSERGVD